MKYKTKYNFKKLLPLGVVIAGTALHACIKTIPDEYSKTFSEPGTKSEAPDSTGGGLTITTDTTLNIIEHTIVIETNQR